jgi:hypothetical protein
MQLITTGIGLLTQVAVGVQHTLFSNYETLKRVSTPSPPPLHLRLYCI